MAAANSGQVEATSVGSRQSFGAPSELALTGRVQPWGRGCGLLLFGLFLVGLWARLAALDAEGFADDEVHKWLAAQRYLHGDFGGDDLEHPMLMKWLIVVGVLVGRPFGLAPETMTRLPCALAGGLGVLVVAWLGRRLFGRGAGLVAAGLLAASTTAIGYNRVAKEDTLVALFLMLALLGVAEAKVEADARRAHPQRRWELVIAVSVGLLSASKYFVFLALVPPLAYAWLRMTGTAWRVSAKRFLLLAALASAVFLVFDWVILLPSTWAYGMEYLRGSRNVHGGLYFAGQIYAYPPTGSGLPIWFYFAFAALKLAPPTVIASMVGLGLALFRRAPAQRLLLTWVAMWALILLPLPFKWGRYFVTLEPALLLLAGYAAASAAAWIGSRLGSASARHAAAAVFGLALISTELLAAFTHAPHYRLYLSALGGGDARITWFFPHCDYFDAGFREAMRIVAAQAEPGAELTTEIDLPARYYLERFGRPDLQVTLFRQGIACQGERACYVVEQVGRRYPHNANPLGRLTGRSIWHIERIRQEEAVRVFRLPPSEDPFRPPERGQPSQRPLRGPS